MAGLLKRFGRPLVHTQTCALGSSAYMGMHLAGQAQHHAARKRFFGGLPTLEGQINVVVNCLLESPAQSSHAGA